MRLISKTHEGMKREQNEDMFTAGRFDDGALWICVCDGMGGAAAGETASMLCVKTVEEEIRAHYTSELKENSIKNMLMSAVQRANGVILAFAEAHPETKGMGTTVVCSIVRNNIAYTVHVGDSRAYRIDKEGAHRLTVDHSVVESLVNQGKITEQEAQEHPQKNIITRVIGVNRVLDVEYNVFELNEDDLFLVCTDGLVNMVDEETIARLVHQDFYDAAEELINAANENGGLDNITVVLAAMKDEV